MSYELRVESYELRVESLEFNNLAEMFVLNLKPPPLAGEVACRQCGVTEGAAFPITPHFEL